MKAYYYSVMVSLLAVNLKFLAAEMSLELTSKPSSSAGPFCQGHVQFTCTGTELPDVLNWVLNGTVIATYSFAPTHTFPFPFDPVPSSSSFPPGVVINATGAARILNTNSININTTLDVSNVSDLNRSSLYCEDSIMVTRSNVLDIEVGRESPPSPDLKCFLQSASGGLEMVLQWSDEFNADHFVERYNVRVIPDPASCTSDQVPPHQNYSCSGLDRMGTNYSVFVTAFNCINQEGGDATYTIQPQLHVPGSPHNVETMLESEVFTVSWMESNATSGRCSFSGAVNYTLILEDTDGRSVEERSVGSDVCINGICSIGFPPSSLYCAVNVIATNEFGPSENATSRVFPPKLTTINQVLLSLGVVLLCVCVTIAGVGVFLIVMIREKALKSPLILFLLVCEIVLIIVAAVLLVAVGFQVGLQKNTCDEDWQNSRDGLIISSFTIICLIFLIVSIIVIVVTKKRKKKPISSNDVSTDDCEMAQTFREIHQGATEARIEIQEKWFKEKQKDKYLEEDQRPKRQETTTGRMKEYESQESNLNPIAQNGVDIISEHRKLGEDKASAMNRLEETQTTAAALQDHPTHYDVAKHPSIPPGMVPPGKVPPQNSAYSTLLGAVNEEYSTLHHNTTTKGNAGGKSGVKPDPAFEGLNAQDDSPLGSDSQSSEDESPDVGMVPCISMRKHNRECIRIDPPIPPEEVAEWFPEHRRWDVKEMAVDHLLVVYLMNDCRNDWKYNEDVITHKLLMEILNNTWKHYFILGPQEDAHIRVQFQGDSIGSWSALGTFAKYIPDQLPTMVLNFSNMNSKRIKATILHQFGHALGLGHALMTPEDWKELKPHVDLREMMDFYGSPTREAFEVQWTGKGLSEDVVNYDKGSIMQYSTDMSWILKGALGKVNRKKLKIFHKHAKTVKSKPTPKDLSTLDIIGCPDISVDHLIYLGNKSAGTEVRITRELADVWYTVGHKLGVKKEKLEAIGESTDYTNDERLKEVWNLWLNNTDELIYRKKYPPSWEGFRKLLKNIGKQNVAHEVFEFLNKL